MANSILILGGRGYVGAALAVSLTAAGCHVGCIDSAPGPEVGPGRSYQNLTATELKYWDTLLVLAGHSSVRACADAPDAAYANNVLAFQDLLGKLSGQRLLFASSASVYGSTEGRLAAETEILPPPLAAYDAQKQEIERLATALYPERSYALRFGTVTGPSPAMRGELLVNSLVRSAVTEGYVRVANRAKHRPILGLHDLGRAVIHLLRGEVPPGPYNLASANCCIGDVADYVAARFEVPCVTIDQVTPYDIQVSTQKWMQATGMAFEDTLDSLVSELADYYRSSAARGRNSR